MISGRFEALILALVVGELLSAIAVLILAFMGKDVFVAANAFGIFLGFRGIAMIVHGLARQVVFARKLPVQRSEQPLKFWLIMVFNLAAIGVGVFLTQLPIE